MAATPMLHTDRVEGALELLHAAGESLTGAHLAGTVPGRASGTRLAVLRAAAAVIAVRGRRAGRGTGPLDVWSLLPRVAPELTEWAQFFEVALPEEGERGWAPSVREADDLLRQGEDFVQAVAGMLGLPPVPVTGALTSLGPATGARARGVGG